MVWTRAEEGTWIKGGREMRRTTKKVDGCGDEGRRDGWCQREEPRDRKAHDPLRRPLEDSGWRIKKKTAALAEFQEPLQFCLQVEGPTHHTV